ncbi:MAG: transcription-repair coupling factor, partial [Myxococcota bacterium]
MSVAARLLAGARIALEDLPPAGLAYELARDPPSTPLLIVCADDDRAERVTLDLRAFGVKSVAQFPGEPHTPFEDISPDPAATFLRMAVRHRLLSGDRPQVIVASAAAVQGRWMPEEAFASASQTVRVDEMLDRDALARRFVACGYQRVNMVEDEGTFAVRGGIVDIFPPGETRPVRLDFLGDEITSIKTFDPESQRTFDSLARLTVHPIRDVVYDDATVEHATARLRALGDQHQLPTRRVRATIDDVNQRTYFYGIESIWPAFYPSSERCYDALKAGAVVVLDGPDGIEETLGARSEHAIRDRDRAIERHRFALGLEDHLVAADVLAAELHADARVVALRLVLDKTFERHEAGLSSWDALAREIGARREDANRGEILDPLVAELNQLANDRYSVFVVAQSRGHAERLRELLRARKVDLPLLESLPPAKDIGGRAKTRVAVCVAPLGTGLRDAARKVAILADTELLGAEPTRLRKKRRKAPQGLTTLRDLTDGDLVVHVDHGIGKYLGLSRLILNGVDGDYVQLEYEGGDKLYVPTYRLSVLQRFRGEKGSKLDKLGGSRWAKAKQRVREAVLAMAHDLLALQAKRASEPGLKLPTPDDHYRAFEATFPYEETADQQKAIDDVLADLTRGRPMDRLICGDVGYGKTEVALRGTALAVFSGYQVAVLVPTTVLAEQHGERFKERFAGQPVTVEVLSRFRGPRETKDLLDKVREGRVDIVIGTHRLLSDDVQFKKLGLLVVDEEQRFGVKHKERIKQLRSQVHVLTLSATPIPRTMHMAMVGLRDLSLIATPPAARVAIRTEVARFDEELIAEAIRREITRGGQTFIVHNRVQSIGKMADIVRTLVPEARVVVAHGQMPADELEKIMVDFVHRESNVLVCTAIIESGIDIPSANTMIVNRADTFGLAQLYQLRGRIGRSRERAFAYLLLPPGDNL